MRHGLLPCFLLLLTLSSVVAQHAFDMQGGRMEGQRTACLPAAMRSQMKKEIAMNILALGLDPKSRGGEVPTNLIFPLIMPDPPPGYFHFSGISGYVDHDETTGTEDYDCQENTYDGHKGTDFFTYPFEWLLVQEDLVHAVSATAGTIVLKLDGNPHNNCERRGSWNAVVVQHDDGSQFWYGHLKSGSLTGKALGDRVVQGEYLGVVASSGYSNGPHLHLECYDASSNLLDPYLGSCNPLNNFSMWETQAPHLSPRINALLTHSEEPSLECGPRNEVSALENNFFPGDQVYVGIYITDYQRDSVITTRVLRPDQTVYATFNSFSRENSYASFYNWRRYRLSIDDPEGIWTVEASYGGEKHMHQFEYMKDVSSSWLTDSYQLRAIPNPTTDEIYLEGIQLRQASYQLFNFQGHLCALGKLASNRLNVDQQIPGIYYLKVQTGDLSLAQKIIISR